MNLENIFELAFANEEMQERFYYELMANDIYVVGLKNHDPDSKTLKLFALDYDGEKYVPIYLSATSLPKLEDDKNQAYFQVSANELMGMLKDDNIIINPGQDNSIVLNGEEIKYLLEKARN